MLICIIGKLEPLVNGIWKTQRITRRFYILEYIATLYIFGAKSKKWDKKNMLPASIKMALAVLVSLYGRRCLLLRCFWKRSFNYEFIERHGRKLILEKQ